MIAAAAGTLALTWSDCGGAHGTTTSVEPSTIALGQTTDIVGKGSTDKEISAGTYDMHMTAAGGLINKHFTGNNCEAKEFDLPLGLGKLSWAGIACPLAVGDTELHFTTQLAAALPAKLAKSDISMQALDQDGESALCVNIHMEKQDSLEEIAARVNAGNHAWTAQAPSKFSDLQDVKAHLGTILKGEEGYVAQAKEVSDVPNGLEVPAEFDVRTAFPDCAEVSGNIRDQSSCGSCWAFGSTEAFNDRHSLPLAARSNSLLRTPLPTVASCSASPWAATEASLAWLGTGSRARVSSPVVIISTLVRATLVPRTALLPAHTTCQPLRSTQHARVTSTRPLH